MMEEFEDDLSISELDAEAIQMYELFSSLQRAGFTEQQSLVLISLIGLPDPSLVVLDEEESDPEE